MIASGGVWGRVAFVVFKTIARRPASSRVGSTPTHLCPNIP